MNKTQDPMDRKTVEQIKRLDFPLFNGMEPHNVNRLTHGFDERYCRLVVCKSEDRYWQERYCEKLREAYLEYEKEREKNSEKGALLSALSPWGITHYKCPAFLNEWSYKLALGGTLTADDISVNYGGGDEASDAQARLDALEAENQRLREAVKRLEANCEPEDEWEEEENPDEGVLFNNVSFEFFLRLLEGAGFDPNNTGNKRGVGILWHMVTGKSGESLRRYCSQRKYKNGHTKDDVKRLNRMLSDLGIESIEL